MGATCIAIDLNTNDIKKALEHHFTIIKYLVIIEWLQFNDIWKLIDKEHHEAAIKVDNFLLWGDKCFDEATKHFFGLFEAIDVEPPAGLRDFIIEALPGAVKSEITPESEIKSESLSISEMIRYLINNQITISWCNGDSFRDHTGPENFFNGEEEVYILPSADFCPDYWFQELHGNFLSGFCLYLDEVVLLGKTLSEAVDGEWDEGQIVHFGKWYPNIDPED